MLGCNKLLCWAAACSFFIFAGRNSWLFYFNAFAYFLHNYMQCVFTYTIICSMYIDIAIMQYTTTGNSTGKLRGGKNLCTRCNKRKESGEYIFFILARICTILEPLINLAQSISLSTPNNTQI